MNNVRPDHSERSLLHCFGEHHEGENPIPREEFSKGGPQWRGGAKLRCRACQRAEWRRRHRCGSRAPEGPPNVGGMTRERVEAALREFRGPVQLTFAIDE